MYVHFNCSLDEGLDGFPVFRDTHVTRGYGAILACSKCHCEIEPKLMVPTYPNDKSGVYWSYEDALAAGSVIEVGRM